MRCGAWRGGFGLEPSIEMYIAHTVEILRELRRVLRADGVVFWNIGDSYASGKGTCYNPGGGKTSLDGHEVLKDQQAYPLNRGNKSELTAQGMKPKDLCLIPERVAIAAQADGWWVRSMIIWAKPNPMPESCRDRPTDAYEHIIMLAKSERYFWDADAVREGYTTPKEYRELKTGQRNLRGQEAIRPRGDLEACESPEDRYWPHSGRNLRNVWTFPTQPYKGSHFATFPEEIPRRCILAATSERGACAQCGAPWQRITERGELIREENCRIDNWDRGKNDGVPPEMQIGGKAVAMRESGFKPNHHFDSKTIGWEATCFCNSHEVKPCIVLDPFGGSGTTARVAVELNRSAVSLDLAYHEHAERRTRHVQRRLQEAAP